MLTFLFVNQTLLCDHSLESSRICLLFLICSPVITLLFQTNSAYMLFYEKCATSCKEELEKIEPSKKFNFELSKELEQVQYKGAQIKLQNMASITQKGTFGHYT